MDRIRSWLVIASLLLPLAHVSGTALRAAAQGVGGDVYTAGGQVAMQSAVDGDAVAAGGRVAVTGRVAGDALLAGGNVSVASSIGQDLYAAGGEVRVAGSVGESARLAGGRVIVAPDADIEGGVTMAGGHVTLDGHVHRYALITAGRTDVNGRVDGDLRVVGGQLSLGPNAVVQGRLDYRGSEPARIAPGAQIHGGISEAQAGTGDGMTGGMLAVWLAGSVVACAALLALAPQASRRVTQALRSRPVVSSLVGVAVLVGLPLVALLLMVTVVGIPLGLLTVVALLALVLMGHLATAAALGDAVVERRAPASTWKRLLAAALALIVLYALGLVPYIGWIVWLLVLLFGIGAIALAALRARQPRPA